MNDQDTNSVLFRAVKVPNRDAFRLLRIYLQDHDGASVGGVQLVTRSAESNRGTSFESDLRDLREAIVADQRSLRQCCDALGVRGVAVKRAGAWAASKLGALKMNGRLLNYSPLSRVIEFEALASAVAAKRELWASLDVLSAYHPVLSSVNFAHLVERADHQARLIAQLHQRAVALAFSSAA